MKRLHMRWPDVHTIRLALTYLLIIMIMSVSFSVVLYRSAAIDTHIKVRSPSVVSTGHVSDITVVADGTSGQTTTNTNHQIYKGYTIPASDIADLNRQIQQALDKARSNELRRLIILNGAVLLLGAGFSYILARRSLRPIENAMEQQSRFASDASHELRTPLTAMQAENEEALRTTKLPSHAKKLIISNLEEITRLKGLTDGLLRLSHDDKTFKLQPVWIDEIGMEATNHVMKQAQAKDITIEDRLLHSQVLGDKKSLIQIVDILLDNAIKYSSRGTVIRLESSRTDKSVLLHVRDEGVGIDSKQLSHVFDRFYRVDQSHSKQAVEGHGLGLSIAQKLVQQQNGKLLAESTLGKGSTFTIKLQISGK